MSPLSPTWYSSQLPQYFREDTIASPFPRYILPHSLNIPFPSEQLDILLQQNDKLPLQGEELYSPLAPDVPDVPDVPLDISEPDK